MNRDHAYELVDRIEFRDWNLRIGEDEDALWLQWEFSAPDSITGQIAVQRGRKWRISRHMPDGEFVQTALLAAFTAVEHEAREDFKYEGKAIFGPHLTLEARVAIADSTEVRS